MKFLTFAVFLVVIGVVYGGVLEDIRGKSYSLNNWKMGGKSFKYKFNM